MNYSSRSNDGCILLVGLGIAIIVGCLAIWYGICYFDSFISQDRAVARFQELAQTQNVQVARHSNDMWFTGNPQDVTYELIVDGKPKQGRCQSGAFSPLICRMYNPGSGD
jgi:hypothetical protein